MPRPPGRHVERPRLTTLLEQGADRPLTLVSAPAGSGKTSLLAAWVARRASPGTVAWLTFEAGDDNPDRFWRLVIESLTRCGLAFQNDETARSPHAHARMLRALGVALSESARPLTLVLDGHEISDADLAKDIEHLLGHSGGLLRIVMLTRVDPVLSLHRFRLEETITELRMADLAFSEEETAHLVGREGVRLSPDSLSTLVARTRGWAAGLRFAALLLAHSANPDETVGQLAGDTGNIAEYLMSEILQTQPADVRELLLRTSVVDVLQPGLVEELGGHAAGRRLTALARGNVLVEELAGRPGWFRYHPFLRDLLRAELAYASPRRSRRLQRRAASWFASHGHVDEAVTLSAASGAWADAVGYAVDGLALGELVLGDDAHGLVQVLRRLPPRAAGPAASVVRAALALADDDLDRCGKELSSAREAADQAGSPIGSTVELAIDVVETVRSCRVSDVGAVTMADATTMRLATPSRVLRAAQAGLTAVIQTDKGVAQLRAGELLAARETLAEAARTAQLAPGLTRLPVLAHAHLSLAASLQGRLRQATLSGERAIALADAAGTSPTDRPAVAEIALGWVSTERCDLSAAQDHLDLATRSTKIDPVGLALAALVRVRLMRLHGAVDDAFTLVEDAREGLPRHAAWLADLLGIEAAETGIARADPDLAIRLVHDLERRVPAAALTLGRAQLEQGDWDGVGDSVAALVGPDAVARGLPTVVGARLLQAAHELHSGQDRRARATLDRSLRLAAPELLRRPFREAPGVVREMLDEDSDLLDLNPWLRPTRVHPSRTRAVRTPAPGNARDTLADGQIIEPLTAKEQEVLGHLSELLSTPEIAAAMFVSVNTVRTHVRSILRKLSVSRRNEAVRRARALRLIAAA